MIDTFAKNTLQLLQTDPRRYRNFGVYWYFVKEVLKRFYTRDNLSLLGDHTDSTVTDRMPPHASVEEALTGAMSEYNNNARMNMGRNMIEDPTGGGTFMLVDPDAAGL